MAAGLFSGRTLLAKRILSDASVKEMTTRQTGEDIPQSYGLGWSTGGGVFGHGGQARGACHKAALERRG